MAVSHGGGCLLLGGRVGVLLGGGVCSGEWCLLWGVSAPGGEEVVSAPGGGWVDRMTDACNYVADGKNSSIFMQFLAKRLPNNRLVSPSPGLPTPLENSGAATDVRKRH